MCRRSGMLKVVAAFYCSLWMLLGFKLMQVPLGGDTGSQSANRLLAVLQDRATYKPVFHNHSRAALLPVSVSRAQPRQSRAASPPAAPPTTSQKAPRQTEGKQHQSVPFISPHSNVSLSNTTLMEFLNRSIPYKVISLQPGESLAVPQDQLWFYNELSTADIWDTSRGDRIMEQLAHMKALPKKRPSVLTGPPKIVLSLMSNHDPPNLFKKVSCPVDNCVMSRRMEDGGKAAAVVFSSSVVPGFDKPPGQVWIYHQLESPHHSGTFPPHAKDKINWTATYRADSTIVTPYEKFVLYNPNIRGIKQAKNYSAGKTKQVAWFVSNCGARNGRLQYAKELGKFVSVDIYGRCGPLKCPRNRAADCFKKLNRDYKFYLAFENSNCKSYITEKFYWNGLWNDVLPIVMGAHPDDYRQLAPPHSYIHVDDFRSPKALAEYLAYLDRNHTAYNEYFQWKGTGTFINTHFMCRVCAMLHERPPDHLSWIPDINAWWRGPPICRSVRWKG